MHSVSELQQPSQLRKQVPPQPFELLDEVQVVGQEGWQAQIPA
jgi:hypothetical protein